MKSKGLKCQELKQEDGR